jgi:hypothetical protein
MHFQQTCVVSDSQKMLNDLHMKKISSITDQSGGSIAIRDGKRLRKRNLAFEKAHLAKIDAMEAATQAKKEAKEVENVRILEKQAANAILQQEAEAFKMKICREYGIWIYNDLDFLY